MRVAEDAAGSEVIAIGEAAGDRQDLEMTEFGSRFDQPVDVPGLDLGADPLPGGDGFFVAVGAREL